MKANTALMYDSKFLEHKTGFHVERPARLEIALNTLQSLNIISSGRSDMVEPRLASVEELQLVHNSVYVDEIRRFCLSGGGHYDVDTVLSKESYDVACLAAGGMLGISEKIFEGKFKNAFGLVRPPGHHAGIIGRAMHASSVGFCVFNNVALTAAYVLEKKWAERILVLDFDVHHGNGTQEVFDSTPQVLYVSIHERGIYPGTGFASDCGEGEGVGYTANIPLPHGSDDTICLKAFDEVVLPVAEQFNPDLVLLSAGYDAHHSDSISTLRLSAQCFTKMSEGMVKLAHKHCEGRLIACLEGGYSEEALSKALPSTVAALTGKPIEITDRKPRAQATVARGAEAALREVKKSLSEYWKI